MKPLVSTIAVALSTLALLALGMVGGGPQGPLFLATSEAAARSQALVDFRSCNGLGTYLWKHRTRSGDAGSKLPDAVGLPGVAPPAAVGGGTAEAQPSPAPTSPTGTNVQEAGIDEPDTVKSAGSAILALAGGDLHAIVTGPDGPTVADTLEMTEGDQFPGGMVPPEDAAISAPDAASSPTSILVHDDLALVIGTGWDQRGATTMLTAVDLSDPSNLRIVKTIEAEGSFVSGRQSGATARLVISAYPDVTALERHRGAPKRWLPALTVHGRDSKARGRRPLSTCTQVDRARRYAGSGLLTLLTLDLEAGAKVLDSDAILTSGETVYASADRMFVATQRYNPGDGSVDRTSSVSTQIHAFSTTAPDSTEYLASGRVPGWMLSQFSMSERDGFLRVASTTEPPWEAGGDQTAKSESFVTVLDERGGELERVGQLGGLGVDERIYAVRFFDDVGYLVTFRQVDPLYALDLSDPREPKLAGELKIPGYSAYLHPVGEGLLLGVGQDADEDGVTQGAQLSLFDVSDLSAPRRLATHSLGRNAYSEVEYDHHAFFYDGASGLSITPYSDWNSGGEGFYGAAGIQVSAAGLTEIAQLHHGAGYRAAITRSLARGGNVYTFSAKGVMRHDPLTLQSSGFANFPED